MGTRKVVIEPGTIMSASTTDGRWRVDANRRAGAGTCQGARPVIAPTDVYLDIHWLPGNLGVVIYTQVDRQIMWAVFVDWSRSRVAAWSPEPIHATHIPWLMAKALIRPGIRHARPDPLLEIRWALADCVQAATAQPATIAKADHSDENDRQWIADAHPTAQPR